MRLAAAGQFCLTSFVMVFHNGTMSSESSSASKKPGKSLVLTSVFGIVVVAALGAAIYFYMQYQHTQQLLKSPNQNAEQEVSSTVEEVGKLIVLPEGERPQVATVSDVNKLKSQQFFANAKNGDRVLIYAKAQKAILYDPIQKKIVEVGPINLAQATPTGAQQPVALKVALYNGTTTTGLTTRIETEFKQSAPNVTVVTKGNAQKNTYTKTTVIDLTGKNANGAADLAKVLGGEVGALPTGEAKPTGADIAVILGIE